MDIIHKAAPDETGTTEFTIDSSAGMACFTSKTTI
jgi:hypothetical protein